MAQAKLLFTVDEGIDGQLSVACSNYGFTFATFAPGNPPARVILQKANLRRLVEVLQAELDSAND
jgi:hypothetical protein